MNDSVGAPASGGFAVVDGAWRYDGALTLENAAAVLAAADVLPLPESGRVDLAGLAQADSAALAVLMALRRRALGEGRTLRIENLPAGLGSLAVVYGVDALAHGTA